MRNNNVSAKDSIILDYSHFGDGESQAGLLCPACQGGSSQEKTLSVSRRDGALLYNCHRASCTFFGAASITGRAGLAWSEQEKAPPALVETYPLDEVHYSLLYSKYGITREVIDAAELRWSGDGNGYFGRRICFPINGPDSKKHGQSLRSYEGRTPKNIIQLLSPELVCQSWFKFKRRSDTLVIVEDCVSAIKLAPHVHTLALLGTHISDAKADEISKEGYSRVLLSLDNDATYEAVKLQLQYRSKIKGLLVASLPKDIKDMNEDEFDDYLLHHIL